MKKNLILILTFSFLLLIGCAQEQVQLTEPQPEEDLSPVTGNVVSYTAITENEQPLENYMPRNDILFVLQQAKKTESLSYNYRGPETGTAFHKLYVKGARIKINPQQKSRHLSKEDSYDSIYVDKLKETAKSYCDNRRCRFKGKKKDLDFDDYNYETPSEWLGKIETSEKIGEEVIESKKVYKYKANDDMIIWIETYYGMPLRVEHQGSVYEFSKIAFNTVDDSDVIPVYDS